jgi:PsbP
MTIVLGINFGHYVLLAADTRAYLCDLSNRPYGVRDDHEKISKTNIGIMGGRGTDRLLELVISKFNELDEVGTTNDLRTIVDNGRQHFRELYPEVAGKSIESTAWIFSYLTFGEGTLDRGTPTLRLGVIGYAVDIIGRRHLVDNCPCVIPPPEATEQDAADITNALKKLIKPIDQFGTLSESIDYHWQVIAKLIQLYEPKFPSISPSCQIGVHTLDGFTGISSILKDTDKTASIALKAPPPPSSSISNLGQLTTLTNEAYRFSISYPETWKKEEARSMSDPVRVCIFLPTGNYVENVSVAMYSLEPNATLDDVIKYALKDILKLKDARILSKGHSTIANHASYTVVFQAILPVQLSEMSTATQDTAIKMKQIYAVNNNALYVVTYKMATERYDKYLALAQRVMSSFAFV